MQCDVCKQKKATVFLTQIIKGEMQKVNMCEGCSKNKGVTDPTGFALADLLLGLGGQGAESATKEKVCPSCGMPQSTFRKTGRVGCSQCYKTFGDSMESLLTHMHSKTTHPGKIPGHALQSSAAAGRIAELNDALKSAVDGEQYEEAARLRDEIKRLAESPAKSRA